ncbi:MAG: EamA family transporter, partial [Bifidobacteriaceae bacterium]|nr:EamA family transporter [Bifidobacteriaceae bacterium]
MKNSSQGAGLAAGAGALWGTAGLAQALAPASPAPAAIGAVRMLIGGIGLFAVLAACGVFARPVRWLARDIAVAGIGLAGLQFGLFSALPRTGVAVGTMVTIGSAPVVAGLLGRLFFGEALTKRWAAATAMALTGCAAIGLTRAGGEADLGGIALALFGGASYALCGVGVKAMAAGTSPLANLAAMIVLAGTILAVGGAGAAGGVGAAGGAGGIGGYRWLGTAPGLVFGLYLGLVTCLVPYCLFAWALKRVAMGKTYTFGLTEPLVAFLFG